MINGGLNAGIGFFLGFCRSKFARQVSVVTDKQDFPTAQCRNFPTTGADSTCRSPPAELRIPKFCFPVPLTCFPDPCSGRNPQHSCPIIQHVYCMIHTNAPTRTSNPKPNDSQSEPAIVLSPSPNTCPKQDCLHVQSYPVLCSSSNLF